MTEYVFIFFDTKKRSYKLLFKLIIHYLVNDITNQLYHRYIQLDLFKPINVSKDAIPPNAALNPSILSSFMNYSQPTLVGWSFYVTCFFNM
jgi:hypothetical protein